MSSILGVGEAKRLVRVPGYECRVDIKRADASIAALVERMEAGLRLGGFVFYEPELREDLAKHLELVKHAVELAEKASA